MPWDAAAVINERRYRVYVEQTIRFHREFPPPVPVTRRSKEGFRLWLKWIDQERDAQRLPEYKPIHERYAWIVPHAYLAFDHRWWLKGHEVVFWYTKDLKAVPLDVIRDYEKGRKVKEQDTGTTDFHVYR